MIVQCPNCDSRYRVNDANVPASGGKITCPSCQHKFLVYPENHGAPPADSTSPPAEDKTSVALRPDLQQLVSKMRQGAIDDFEDDSDLGAATEVMSSDAVPDFPNFHARDVPDDGTVEMKNPYLAGDGPAHDVQFLDPDEFEEDDSVASTEVLSDDVLEDMGFAAPTTVQPKPKLGKPKFPTPSLPKPDNQGLRVNVPQRERAPSHAGSPLDSIHTRATTPQPTPSPFSAPTSAPQDDTPPSADTVVHSPDLLQSDAPDPAHEGPWKLKTNFGLTYEFPDNKSLRNWLTGREELDGYELAGDADFYPVTSWPQFQSQLRPNEPRRGSSKPTMMGMGAVNFSGSPNTDDAPAPRPAPQTPAPASPQGQAPAGPQASPQPGAPTPFHARAQPGPTPQPFSAPNTGPQPATPSPWDAPQPADAPRKPITPTDYRPPSRDSLANWILWPLAGILFAVVIVLALQVLGVYDIKRAVLGEPASPAQPQTPEQPEALAPPADPAPQPAAEPADPDPEIARAVDRLLDDARQALENSRLQSASAKLNNAKLLSPERIEIYVMLEDVYTKMGRDKEAEAARARAEALRGEAQDAAPAENGADPGAP